MDTAPSSEEKRRAKPTFTVLGTVALACATAFAAALGTGLYNRLKSLPVEAEPVAAVVGIWDASCEQLVIDRSEIERVPQQEESAKWIYSRGGGTTGASPFTLALQGRTEEPVVIHGIDIVELERAPLPPDPVLLDPCGGTGGGLEVRSFTVDLDARQPHLVAHPQPSYSANEGTPKPAVTFPYQVSLDDPEFFSLEIKGLQECVCTWRMAVRWTNGSRSGTTFVGRGGSMIRSATGLSDVTAYEWEGEGDSEKLVVRQ